MRLNANFGPVDAYINLALLAGFAVGFVHLRKMLFELFSDASTHYSNAVYRIH